MGNKTTAFIQILGTVLLLMLSAARADAKLHHNQRLQKRAITQDEVDCVNQEFDEANTDSACVEVKEGIEALFDSEDWVSELADGISSGFAETFCQPGCGQVIIDVLGECGLYDSDDLKREVNLFIGLCESSKLNGPPCYSLFTDVVALYGQISGVCYNDGGSCPSECSNDDAMDAVQNVGCCINLPIEYLGLQEDAEGIFEKCGITLSGSCSSGPLGPPSASSGPPGTDGGNGAGSATCTAGVVLIAAAMISAIQ